MIFNSVQFLEQMQGICPAPVHDLLQYFAKITSDGLAYTLPVGKHPVDGKDVFFVVAENMTKPLECCRPEIHAAYLDIHYVVSGEELIGVSLPSTRYVVEEDRIANDDIAFFSPQLQDECFVRLTPGQFLIAFPYEIHRPVCAAHEPVLTRKLIGKVHVNRLKAE